ncbi:tetratricopeptide repeat protein [Nonlabens ulvanivorans]|uniref:tetratricopeptide repeat protein n=1 Tax=Nonlabens ulvanivorans TaxID=906888 RepID=UPI002943971C|nr:tetratricopeptide repeat protein [Nonlabens ulvanivorans]WOI22439.1 tetratricopeptide repeat protein [Nonlabens ulvanivorans]
MSNSHKHIICVVALSLLGLAFAKAQQNKELDKAYDTAVAEAQEYTAEGDFNQAEASYRKATALKPGAAESSYNLGTLYYNNDKKFNSVENYKKAAEASTSKEEKHKIYHNLGNSFLENKQYDEAVEAYKNALRNDPTDDETRYNLALAKQEKEKNGGGGGGGNDDQDQDKDQDNKEGDKDENSDGDNEGDQNEKDGKDQEGDKGDQKESDKGENSEGENGDGKPKEQNQGQQPQRVEGKLTPQQARQLLEAMSNEEQKIQEKVNAKKAQGKSVKTEKDW